jgi:hypothetical protein
VAFAAFFMKPYPQPAALLKIIPDSVADDGGDADERVVHQPEQGAVTQPDEFDDIDRFQQPAHLGAQLIDIRRDHRLNGVSLLTIGQPANGAEPAVSALMLIPDIRTGEMIEPLCHARRVHGNDEQR